MNTNFRESSQALTLESFWRWAAAHYNCILRAGSDQCIIYDQNDLHWHLIEEEDDLLVVQLIRGKELIAELVIDARQVMYVESSVQNDDNVLFELVSNINGEPVPLYHFVMAHGFDEAAGRNPHEWTH